MLGKKVSKAFLWKTVSAHASEYDAGSTCSRQTIWILNFLQMQDFTLEESVLTAS